MSGPALNLGRFVKPRVFGENNKKNLIYILGEAPGEEEERLGYTFVGRSGKLLDRALEEAKISSARLFNVVPFRPVANQTPSDEQIEEYKEFAISDITLTKPRVIVCAGRIAAKAILGNFLPNNLGEARDKLFNFNGIPVIVTWHPSYVLRSGGSSSQRYKELVIDLIKSKRIAFGENLEGDFECLTVDVEDYKLVDYFLRKVFERDDLVVLDYEGTSLDTLFEDFDITLMGLYSPTKNVSLIISFYGPHKKWKFSNLDNYSKSLDVLRRFLLEKRFLVYNVQYELLVTWSIFNVELKNPIDLFALAKSKGYGQISLKDLSSEVLHSFKWNDDVETWNKNAQIFNSSLSSLKDFYTILKNMNDSSSEEDLMNSVSSSKESKKLAIAKESLSILLNLHNKYKVPFDVSKNSIIRIATCKNGNVFGECPHEILIGYCAKDVFYTWKLYESLYSQEDALPLEIYNNQALLSAYMTASGIPWDLQQSYVLEERYKTLLGSILRMIILHRRSSFLLEESKLTREQVELSSLDFLIEKVFNPVGTGEKTRSRLSKMVLTPRVKICILLFEISQQLNSLGELAKLFHDFSKSECKISYIDDIVSKKKSLSDILDVKRLSKTESDLVKECLRFSMESTKSEVIEKIYTSVCNVLSIDVDDITTWVDEFEILFYVKLYRKIYKCITAFIQGRVGRQCVALVKREDCNSFFPRRVKWIKDFSNQEEISKLDYEKYFAIQIPDWKPNAAETKRWKSPSHTVPWDSDLSGLRISRYSDGIVIHADYSQMEVRVLAAVSQETQFLKAFEEGIDIHRFCASKVFGKPQDQITDFERRSAKAITFSILYGQSVEGLAKEHLRGDVELSKQLFSSLFDNFPRIRHFIKECHRSALEYGYVKTIFGDKLFVGMPEEGLRLPDRVKEAIIEKGVYCEETESIPSEILNSIAEALRAAQNYPIQSIASSLSAISMWNIFTRCRKENLIVHPNCFTHDSMDFDQRICDLRKTFPVFLEESVRVSQEKFNVPVKADFEIGLNCFDTLEISDVKFPDSNTIVFEFEGKKKSLDKIINRLSNFNFKFSYQILESKTKKKSWSELFVGRKSYSLDLGKVLEYVKGHLEINFSRSS